MYLLPIKAELDKGLLETAKCSFNVRRIDFSIAQCLITKTSPKEGDVVLASIEKLGQHPRIQLKGGRRARLYEGDLVLLAYANRYAMDQFEAVIPKNLSRCHMVAAGGIASKMVSHNTSMKNPTSIKPLGLLADSDGNVINTAGWALPSKLVPKKRKATVIVVVGTEMNAGKTTTASSIIRSAFTAGLRVGAAKITGTGAKGDYGEMLDAGAHYVYDLIDAGYPSTYKLPNHTVLEIFETLTAHLLETDAEIIVLEIADGVLQQETKALLESPVFQENIDSMVLAAGDSLAAKAGASVLGEMGLPLVAISGKVTSSAVGCRASKESTGYPVFSKKKLSRPESIPLLLPRLDVKITASN